MVGGQKEVSGTAPAAIGQQTAGAKESVSAVYE
jgi:hypothetical protein